MVPSATYRATDFLEAARRLGAEVTVASERRQAMSGLMGNNALTVPLGRPREAAERIARRITALLPLAGQPTTLSECGISATILPLLAEEANRQWTARFNPRPVGEAERLAIYQSAK